MHVCGITSTFSLVFPLWTSSLGLWAGCAARFDPTPICLLSMSESVPTWKLASGRVWWHLPRPPPTSVLVLVAFEAQVGTGPQWLARQSTVRPSAAASPVASVLCWCIERAPMPKHRFTFLGLLKCPYFNKKVHISCFLCTQTKKRKTKHKIHMM